MVQGYPILCTLTLVFYKTPSFIYQIASRFFILVNYFRLSQLLLEEKSWITRRNKVLHLGLFSRMILCFTCNLKLYNTIENVNEVTQIRIIPFNTSNELQIFRLYKRQNWWKRIELTLLRWNLYVRIILIAIWSCRVNH